jgi:transcriptional antiterminator NusG
VSDETVDGLVAELPDAVLSDGVEAPDAVAEDVVEVETESVETEAVEAEVEAAAEAVETDATADPAADFLAELRARDGDWYVVHSYSGHEKRVKQAIEHRIESLHMEDFIYQVEVPMEQVTEIKGGQRKQVTRVRMPGYVLVRMDLTDESWGAVRNTPGVTGFVGHAHQPVPLTLDEVVSMLAPAEAPAAAGGRRLPPPRPSRSTSTSASRSPSSTDRSRLCQAPSPRSRWSPRSFTFSFRSSAGRPRSSCRSTRSRRSSRRQQQRGRQPHS